MQRHTTRSALLAKLYLIYIDELINILSKSGKGAIMIDLNVGCPVQADDIALSSSNIPFMQSLMMDMLNERINLHAVIVLSVGLNPFSRIIPTCFKVLRYMCSIQQKMEIQVFSSKKSSNEIHETYNVY
jgi:hypothetical protein